MKRWLELILLLLAASAFGFAPEPRFVFQFDGANRLTNTITPLGRSTTVAFNHQGLPASVDFSPLWHRMRLLLRRLSTLAS